MKRAALTFAGVLVLVAALGIGITQLLSLRMAAGDIYPAYSSLRADPLGVKALTEALSELPGVEVERSYRPPRRSQIRQATIFFAGVRYHGLDDRDLSTSDPTSLPARVSLGSRLVVTVIGEDTQREVTPRTTPKPSASRSGTNPGEGPVAATPKPTPKASPTPRNSRRTRDKKKAEDDEEDYRPDVSVTQLWGFKTQLWKGPRVTAFKATAELEKEELGLEPEITWHSAVYFEDLVPAWRVIYKCKGKPVVIQRAWGDGTIVLASDSYFLSNEALHEEVRHPKLLAWLVGANPLIVFDEQHHHLSEQAGIMTLVHRYRMHGVVIGLGVLALLFIWQQVIPFAPRPRSREAETGIVSGRSSEEGLITLLRRSVPPADLLETCVGEWRRTGTHPKPERDRLEAAWAAVRAAAPKQKSVVEGYRALLAALRKGRK